MLEDVIYSINCFHRLEFEGEKSYFALQATSQEEERRMEETFDQNARAWDYMRGRTDGPLVGSEATRWVSGHIQIGWTTEGQMVILAVDGFVEDKEGRGNSVIIICNPNNYEELRVDLAAKGRRAAAKIEKRFQALLQRN